MSSSLIDFVGFCAFGNVPKLWWWKGRKLDVYSVEGCMAERIEFQFSATIIGKPFMHGMGKLIPVRDNKGVKQTVVLDHLRRTRDGRLVIIN